jgi:hypothetical protein
MPRIKLKSGTIVLFVGGGGGTDAREIEIQSNGTAIQQRYVGDLTWTDIVLLADLKGNDGAKGNDGNAGSAGTNGTDGKQIELQKGITYIQWRFVGDSVWNDLVSLASLKGDKGDTGNNGANGYTPVKGVDYFDGAKGDKGDQGIQGEKGLDGAGAGFSVVTVDADTYNATQTTGETLFDCIYGNAIMFQLPTAVGNKAKFSIVNNSGFDVMIMANGAEHINDDSFLTIQFKHSSVILLSTGSGWRIL